MKKKKKKFLFALGLHLAFIEVWINYMTEQNLSENRRKMKTHFRIS